MTSTAKYAAPRRRWHGLSRIKKVFLATGALATIGALVAVAAILMRADIDGSARVIASDIKFTSAEVLAGTVNGEIQCEASVSDGKMTVDVEGWAGTSCDVRAKVISTGDDIGTIKVQDITYNSTISARFVNGCGMTIPKIDTTNNLTIRFSIPDGTASGTYPASAEAGLIGVLADDYVDANCPRA